MMMNDPMSPSRHNDTCPYCRESIIDRVDAEVHILGCGERWRREHFVDTPVAPGATPTLTRWSVPEPVSARIESTTGLVRRVIAESSPYSTAFRTLPGYEPAA
jgi:hypothetical protein